MGAVIKRLTRWWSTFLRRRRPVRIYPIDERLGEGAGPFQSLPDHAVREVTQPLTSAAVRVHQRHARKHERTLAPLRPPPDLNEQLVIEMLTWYVEAKRRGVLP